MQHIFITDDSCIDDFHVFVWDCRKLVWTFILWSWLGCAPTLPLLFLSHLSFGTCTGMALTGLIPHHQAVWLRAWSVNAAGMCPIHNTLLFLVDFSGPPPPSSWKRWRNPLTGQLSNLDHVFSTKVQTVRINTLSSVHTYVLITFFVLCVCDLQVAVPGSELLPAHDLPLQIPQGDVRAVKNHSVIAEFGGEFIMNMSHGETKQKPRPPLSENRQFVCDDRTPVSW